MSSFIFTKVKANVTDNVKDNVNEIETSNNSINLQSSDGEIFKVDSEMAKKSSVIKTLIEDLGIEDNSEEIIPLLNVNAATLKKVIEYLQSHKDDKKEHTNEYNEDNEKISTDISLLDKQYIANLYSTDENHIENDHIENDHNMLFAIILAANYLDIKDLLDLTCKTVANMIKGKTPEEIRKTFDIKSAE